MEEIARIPFIDPDCNRLRNAVLTVHQFDESLDNKKLLEHLSKEGYEAELERLDKACALKADPHFAPNAEREQVQEGWRHVMMLHDKAGVPSSLLEAESEWMSDQSDENSVRLIAVKQQVEIVST
jgi:DNA primase